MFLLKLSFTFFNQNFEQYAFPLQSLQMWNHFQALDHDFFKIAEVI